MRDEDCVAFLKWALPRLELRWPGYRRVRRQVCRRIARRMRDLGLAGLEAYRARLEADPAEWTVLDPFCRITVTRFYRDPQVFDVLRMQMLPDLARRATALGEASLRCWSVGCGGGEEPYSLTILWRLDVAPRFPGLGLAVLATDSDDVMLARARAARYAAGTLSALPRDFRDAAFVREDGRFRLRPAFREGVTFLEQDVREVMPEGPFHVILCRNLVFTYFAETLQRRLLPRLARRLAAGGVLVLGRRESLPRGAEGFRAPVPGLPLFRKSALIRGE